MTLADGMRQLNGALRAAFEGGEGFQHRLSRGEFRESEFIDALRPHIPLRFELTSGEVDPRRTDVAQHPFYQAFFRCWNEQRYYEAHDVLEQLWLKTDSSDADFFKGLIQAAGAFVHLQKRLEHPSHPKHSRRLQPAVRLFLLAERNLSMFSPRRHGLDVAALCQLLHAYADKIVASDYKTNPWSPKTAPRLEIGIR